MARLDQVVIDCRHPAALARFWAAALDAYEVRPYDDAEVARLTALGHTPDTDPVVFVDGPGPDLCFQLEAIEPREKTPLHLDISSSERAAEVARLEALGASVVQEFGAPGDGHVWMRDPEGNDFCITD